LQHFTKLWILGFLFLTPLAFAYENPHEEEWEIGLSLGYASLPDENEEGTNVHLHIMKHLEGEGFEYFSLGLGFEMIGAKDTHYATMFTMAVHPTEDLTLAFSPSIVWEKHEDEWGNIYASHFEVSYVFDVSEHFHIGPVIGYSTSAEADHYTFGLHLGIPL
jgi:hypothetical protein